MRKLRVLLLLAGLVFTGVKAAAYEPELPEHEDPVPPGTR